MSRPELFIAYDPIYAHPLPEGHRFPMAKYELIPGQLLYEGTIRPAQLHPPKPCPDDIILKTHTAGYLHKLQHQELSASEQRRIGFPQSPELTLRERIITQGTIDCCHAALRHGVALNVAGGTHHAFADRGEGFCLLNDFAIAARYLLDGSYTRQILVIDLDVHQGNGTARLFAEEPRVFTFSMHGKNNYPFQKEKSDLDVELADGTDTATYLELLHRHLPSLLDTVQPDFAFYLSGVDILETDKFGKLKVTPEGCRARDVFVFEQLQAQGIPCTVSMGGGYSPQVRTIVDAHCATFRAAGSIYGLH
ncbi:MAG TPA: histone deacetylase [Chitinophagaceae bacterium]|jgi:acetoin utilization deacetylase AcuC-like enzyme|nr:histone deacetylase [Chitinophagaceae bacterium]